MRKLVVGCLVAISFCFGSNLKDEKPLESLVNKVMKEVKDVVNTKRKDLVLSLNDQDNMIFYGRLAVLGAHEIERVNKKLGDKLFECGYANPLVVIDSIESLTDVCPSEAFNLVEQITAISKMETEASKLTIETMLFSGASLLVAVGQIEKIKGDSK